MSTQISVASVTDNGTWYTLPSGQRIPHAIFYGNTVKCAACISCASTFCEHADIVNEYVHAKESARNSRRAPAQVQ